MVEWGNYAEAYKTLHDKLDEILTKIDNPADLARMMETLDLTTDVYDKLEFTYNVNDNVETIKYLKGAATLLTLTFAYDAQQNVTSITRS